MPAPDLTIQVERFDIRSQLAQGLEPALLMKRDVDDSTRVVFSHARAAPDGEWYILHEKFKFPGTAGQPHWSINRSSPQIVIPLFDYLLPDPNPEVLVHFGAQTGTLATLLAFRLPPDCFVTKMLLAIGNVFTRSDGQQGFQVWVGFAARVEKRGG